MTADLATLIHRVAADPSKLGALTPDQQHALRDQLALALGNGDVVEPVTVPTVAAQPGPAWGPDDILTAEEAAAALRVSPRWLYRHAKSLPFARKLSPKVLRFSRLGMARWMATKRP